MHDDGRCDGKDFCVKTRLEVLARNSTLSLFSSAAAVCLVGRDHSAIQRLPLTNNSIDLGTRNVDRLVVPTRPSNSRASICGVYIL